MIADQAVLSAVRDAVFVADIQTGMILDANPAAEALCGRSLAELRLLHHTERYPSGQGESARYDFEGPAPVFGSTQGIVLHKDGRRIPVEIASNHFMSPGGTKMVVGVFRDITERNVAREALRRSEERFRQVAESAGEFIWEVNADGVYLYASRAVEPILGFTPEELVGKMRPYDLLVPEAREEMTQVAIKTMARHEPFRALLSWRLRKDGRRVALETSGLPFWDEGGVFSGYRGASRDVTGRMEAEEQLRERERKAREAANELRAIMDAAPASIFIAHDSECRRITGNRTANALLRGRPGSNLSKTAPDEELPVNFRVIRDGIEIPPSELPIQKAARTGQPVLDSELDVVFEDGSSRHLMGNVEPLLDENGHPRGAVAVLADITERKRQELELRKFLSLAENSGEFIGMCDMNFMPFYANSAALSLVGLDSLEQAQRTPVPEFFFPEDQHFITEQFFPRVIREGRAEVEIRFRHFKTGSPLWVIYNVFFIQDPAGQPVGLATVSRDITDRKNFEEALRERSEMLRNSEQALRKLAGSVLTAQEDERRRISRELHDDVTQRLAFLSIELDKLNAEIPHSNENMRARVRALQEQTLQMSSEVRRLSHGLHPSAIEDFGLSIALEEFCHQFEVAKKVTVKFEGFIDDSRLDATGAACLYRVAQEGVRNAQVHGGATDIRVDLSTDEERIRLRILDNGRGFSTDDPQTKTGLGLISMRERVRFVNGMLTISSYPGQGTEIVASVPLTGVGHEKGAYSAG